MYVFIKLREGVFCTSLRSHLFANMRAKGTWKFMCDVSLQIKLKVCVVVLLNYISS